MRPVRAKANERNNNQVLLSLQDVISSIHPTQGDTLGYKLLGFQPVNLLFNNKYFFYFKNELNKKTNLITDINERQRSPNETNLAQICDMLMSVDLFHS